KPANLYEKKEMNFDYVFLMPVFNSITGCYQSGYYEDELKTAIKKSREKIVVLGGVSIDQIEKINEKKRKSNKKISKNLDTLQRIRHYSRIVYILFGCT